MPVHLQERQEDKNMYKHLITEAEGPRLRIWLFRILYSKFDL